MMLNKSTLVLIALLIFASIPSVNALFTSTLYSGTVQAGDNISAESTNFTVGALGATGPDGPQRLILESASRSFYIDKGACEQLRSPFENLYACYLSSEYGTPDPLFIRRFKLSISISKLLARMELDRKIENKLLLVGESSKVISTFRNIGDRKAENVIFKDNIPKEIGVTITNGVCHQEGNSIIWTGEMSPDAEISCSYTIKANTPIKYRSVAEISYFDGRENEFEDHKSTITVQNFSLVSKFNLSHSEVELYQRVNLTVNLSNNNDDYSIKIAPIQITVPIGLRIRQTSGGATILEQRIIKSISLGPEESAQFVVELEAKRIGNYTIKEDVRYQINNQQIDVTDINSLVVGITKLVVDYSKVIMPDGQTQLIATLRNPGKHKFNTVNVQIASDLPIQTSEYNFAALEPQEWIRLVDTLFTPFEEKNYETAIKLSYKAPNGQLITDKFRSIVASDEKEAGTIEEVKQESIESEVSEQEPQVKLMITEEVTTPEIAMNAPIPRAAVIIINIVLIILIILSIKYLQDKK
jgi:hypothetical protein